MASAVKGQWAEISKCLDGSSMEIFKLSYPAPSIQFPMFLVLMHCQQHLLRAESAIKGVYRSIHIRREEKSQLLIGLGPDDKRSMFIIILFIFINNKCINACRLAPSLPRVRECV